MDHPDAQRYNTDQDNASSFDTNFIPHDFNLNYGTQEYMDSNFMDIWKCLNQKSTNNSTGGVNNESCFTGDIIRHLGTHGDSAEYDILKSPTYAISVIICYIIVISLGALGNSMVVLTVVKAKQMRNATNIFIANLAVADIFVCVFDLPLSAYYQITGQWIFGATLCRVIPMVFAMVVYSSTLTLTMIAIDRFILVVHPLRTRLTPSLALVFIAIIAVLSVAVAFPIAVYGHFEIYEDKALNMYKRLCYEHWPTVNHRRIYTILTLLFQYFVPLIIIAVLYARIFLRIRTRITRGRCNRRTKTTKMLVAVVTVFACAWTPYHIHSLLSEYGINPFGIYYKFADAILRVLAMSSSCLNPFLYGWLNDNYKNAFLSLIRKPTQPPKGIRREDSDRTQTRSNVFEPSPIPRNRKAININADNNSHSDNCNSFLAPPERVPLQKLRQKGVKNGNAYHSIAQYENDPKSPVIIVILHDDTNENVNNNKQ